MNVNFYKQLIEESPAGYSYQKIICDGNGVPCDYEFIEVNSSFEELTGINRCDIVGKKINELISAIDIINFEDIGHYGDVALNGGKKEFERYSKLLQRFFRITIYSPEKYYFVTYYVDITKDKTEFYDNNIFLSKSSNAFTNENQEDFTISNESVPNILNKTNMGTWKWNIQNGKICFSRLLIENNSNTFNKTTVSMKAWLEFIHPDDVKATKMQFDRILSSEATNFIVEYRIKNINNRFIWIQDKGKVISWSAEGKPLLAIGTYSDITECKHLNETVRENSTFLSNLLDGIPTPLFHKNIDGKYLGCNKAFEDFFGMDTDKLIGKTSFDINPVELASIYHAKDVELFEQPGVQTYETIVKDMKNNLHNVIFHKATITNSHGDVTGLIGAILDITDRKRMEEDLRASEEKYRMIFNHTPLGVLHFNNNGIITDCNDNFVRIIGSSSEALIGINILNLPNKIISSALYQSLQGKLATYEGDYKSVTANKITPIRVIFAPILLQGEVITGGVGIVEDITERKRLELALSNEKKLLETTLLSVGDGVISTDKEGKIVFLNKVAEFLTGFTQEEAREKAFEDVFNIIDEYTKEKSENIVEKVLKSGETLELANHTILISKDNIHRPIEDSAAPIIEENGKIIGAVLVFRDVTDKQEKRNEILYLSYHDQLTGLYNRRFYEEELIKLDKKENLPLTIAMGDVNGLKLINDSFGHEMGDELIKKVAKTITNGCRENDIIARLGGDEFVIILPKTDSFEAEQIMKRIKKLASNEIVGSIGISISFGYDTKNTEDELIGEIFKKAEDHMYKKKLYESPSVRGKTIGAIINTLCEKNKREGKHSRRVSELCEKMGIALYAHESEIEELKTVGLLHDIGKIAIDENILNKPNKLTDDEWTELKRHPEIGYRILNTVNDMSDMAEYVLSHHERWDGKGYPKGIKGEDIPFVSRIISIADAFDAMTSERSYRSPLSEELALEELHKNAGSQFDPELVSIFIEKVLGNTSEENMYK